MRATNSAGQLSFTFAASVIPRGDGSYIVQPAKPVQQLTVAQAARVLGVSPSTVYRLKDSGLLHAARPSPHKILISAESLESHRCASSDPEFWDRR